MSINSDKKLIAELVLMIVWYTKAISITQGMLLKIRKYYQCVYEESITDKEIREVNDTMEKICEKQKEIGEYVVKNQEE